MVGIQMNPAVIAKMMTTPFTVYPQGKVNSVGDTVTQAPISLSCYKMEDFQTILNSEGKEEITGTQLYVKGSDLASIELTSLISYDIIEKQRIIRKASFDGPLSTPVIGVIYLP